MKTCRVSLCLIVRNLNACAAGLLLLLAADLPAQAQYLEITGSGTVGTPNSSAACLQSICADFNNNGTDDIFYFDLVSQWYSVLLDPGINGLSSPPTASLTFPGGPPNVLYPPYTSGALRGFAAELTGDGNVDVVLLYHFAGMVVLYPGLGNGTFAVSAAVVLPAGMPQFLSSWDATLLPIDFDNNGVLDIVVMRPSAMGNSANVLVSLRNQHPTWTAITANTLPVSATLTGTGDYDGDGNLDLLMTASDGVTNTGCLPLWGVGNGTFTGLPSFANSTLPYVPYVLIGNPCSQVIVKWVGDANADGRDDALINYYCASPLGSTTPPVWQELLYYGNANRTFLLGSIYYIPSAYPTSASTAWAGDVSACGLYDMDLDGVRDIFLEFASIQSSAPPTVTVQVSALIARGLGGGAFDPVPFATIPPQFNLNPNICLGMMQTHVSDFDGDGDLDVFRGASLGLQLYLRNRSSVGTGCPGTLSVPLLSHGIAAVGNALHSLSVSGAVPNAAAVIAVSLGMNTSPLNACGVYIDTLSSTAYLPGTTNALGSFTWPLPLPNNPLLHGVSFYAQAAVLDPLGPNLGGLNLALTPARTIIVW